MKSEGEARESEGEPLLSARCQSEYVGKLGTEKMVHAKSNIAKLKRQMTMLLSEELNAAGHPLTRDALVINENCAALMCEWRC